MSDTSDFTQQAADFRERYNAVKNEVGKVIVGHEEIVHGVLTCMMIGGHCLLEGAPGLGKTLLVSTLSKALSLDSNRIQFTPDLKGRSLRRSVWRMKSTGRLLRLNRRCWRRCRKVPSPLPVRVTN